MNFRLLLQTLKLRAIITHLILTVANIGTLEGDRLEGKNGNQQVKEAILEKKVGYQAWLKSLS